ncbi:Putative cytosolic protein [Borrelia hermsii MTW]|nr:Putative cytosolic protein [Borrelia hermsii MTW]
MRISIKIFLKLIYLMLRKIKNKMVGLDDYLIVCNDFQGRIEIFFDYIRNKREILKTFNLNKIIEDFLIFSESIEIDVKDLIKFYSFSTSLLYLKTQILYPVELKDKKLVEREIVQKLINYSEKYAEVRATASNLKDGVCLNVPKSSFFKENGTFLESADNIQDCNAEINKVKSKVRVARVERKHNDIPRNTKLRSNIILGTYDSKISDKKTKIIALLTKEDNLVFEFLLDFDDKFYFFDKFCYFLIVLEYKMANIIDLVYTNDKLVLMKGKNIDESRQ